VTGVPREVLILAALFVVGLLAGLAKQRFALLVAGLVVVAVGGALLAGVNGAAPRAQEWTQLLTVAVPLLVAFLTGWLVARGSWFRRIVVVAAAALLLAALPYSSIGAAIAGH
jgi:hypothetical protein